MVFRGEHQIPLTKRHIARGWREKTTFSSGYFPCKLLTRNTCKPLDLARVNLLWRMSLIKVSINQCIKAMEKRKMQVPMHLCILPLYESYNRTKGDKGLWVKFALTKVKNGGVYILYRYDNHTDPQLHYKPP